MTKNQSTKSPEARPEGEGSYSATRKYNSHLAEATSESSTREGADEARRAIEGPEAAELAEAERIGKSGSPKRARTNRH